MLLSAKFFNDGSRKGRKFVFLRKKSISNGIKVLRLSKFIDKVHKMDRPVLGIPVHCLVCIFD